jgi:hypothetical protein
MVTAHVPTLCTLSARCLRSQRCSRKGARAKSREKVGGVRGMSCSTRSERAHFFWRCCGVPVAWGGFGGTNVRPLIIALVVSIRNHRDGRVATFRPIPQSVSGVGVRFSIGDKIRNLGEKSFFASPGARGSFLYYCGVVIIFLSLFSRNWESDVSSETLWRSCAAGRGAVSAS